MKIVRKGKVALYTGLAFAVYCFLAGAMIAFCDDNGKAIRDADRQRVSEILRQSSSHRVAEGLARERYQLLCDLTPDHHFPLYTMGFPACIAVFPKERSDRVYVEVWGSDWPQTNEIHGYLYCILCYQRTNGKIRQIYRADFRVAEVTQLAGKGRPEISSISDYVRSEGGKFSERISRFAKNDLAANREYIAYEYQTVISTLMVYPLSVGKSPDNPAGWETYFLERDPLSNTAMSPGDFYRKYGLPISAQEWKAIQNSAVPSPLVFSPHPLTSSKPMKRPRKASERSRDKIVP